MKEITIDGTPDIIAHSISWINEVNGNKHPINLERGIRYESFGFER